MRFQLWRRVGTVPKDTLGTYAKVGQVTTHNESPWNAGSVTEETDPWVGINFTTTDRVPIAPGDLLLSARTQRTYKVMSVELNVGATAHTECWNVGTRQLQRFERFAKHRDYTQCTKHRRKHHADPST